MENVNGPVSKNDEVNVETDIPRYLTQSNNGYHCSAINVVIHILPKGENPPQEVLNILSISINK